MVLRYTLPPMRSRLFDNLKAHVHAIVNSCCTIRPEELTVALTLESTLSARLEA